MLLLVQFAANCAQGKSLPHRLGVLVAKFSSEECAEQTGGQNTNWRGVCCRTREINDKLERVKMWDEREPGIAFNVAFSRRVSRVKWLRR